MLVLFSLLFGFSLNVY